MTRPGESVEGITVPLGDPDALLGAGRQLQGVGAQLEASSSQIAGMPSLMGSWAGPGSSTFAELTGHQATSMQSTGLTVTMAGMSIQVASDQLKDAQQKAQRAIVRAKKARQDINEAKEAIREALDAQRDARDRMTMATIARQAAETRLFGALAGNLAGDGAAAAAIDAADAAYRDAERDLLEAERRERRARDRLKDAEDDMRDARRDGQEAADDAETIGVTLQAVLRGVPPGAMAMPGAPSEGRIAAAGGIHDEDPREVPLSEREPPKDWPWWAKSLYKVGRGEATAIAGTVGMAKQAYHDPEKIPGGFAALGSAAYHDPIGTGKGLIGYEQLANGRYEDWFGMMGLGALSGGAGAGTSRLARLNRVVGSPNVTRLGSSAPRWSSAFAGRKVDFSKPDLGARPGSNVTIPANREALAAAYPKGVRYTRAGYPIFTPYAEKTVVVPHGLNGDMANDAPLANQAAGLDKTPRGYTWHHVEDGRTMELVPTKLHRPVAHTGGRAAMPDQVGLVTPGSAFTPFEQGAGAAGAAGAFGAAGPAPAR